MSSPRNVILSMVGAVLVAALIGGAPRLLMAADADKDSDGLTDEIEELLGTDPNREDGFVSCFRREKMPEGNDLTRTVKSVSLANAGQNRFVWRVEFADTYAKQNSNLILYLDADNDAKTGRQPGHGCEFMLFLINEVPSASAYSREGTQSVAPLLPRTAVEGPYVYVSYDVDLKQQDGNSVFRLNVLSETADPHKAADSTGYFSATGPGMGTHPKIVVISDATESVNVDQTWGLEIIDASTADKKNILFPITECSLKGFFLQPSEYRADCAIRIQPTGSITATVQQSGEYYPGFVLHDAAGREVVGLFINGERRGVAVAGLNDSNQHLFFLRDRVKVRQGDIFELRALTPEGVYRIESLVLLSSKPAPRPPLYEIRNVSARENRLTFITTWPVTCTIEQSDGKETVEPLPVNNHRVYLSLEEGKKVRYRIHAVTREGREIVTPWKDHAWTTRPEFRTTQSGKVTLTVAVPDGKSLTNWPVTSGVPFPKGALGSDRNLSLTSSDGKEVPLQTSVTGRWPDSSVKWVLLDFRHSGGSGEYTLAYGPRVQRRSIGGIPQKTDFGTLVLRDMNGKEFRADLNNSVVEEEGIIRKCLRSSWSLVAEDGTTLFSCDARFHLYPGLPVVKALITITNDASQSEFTTVRSAAWSLPGLKGNQQFVRQHTDNQYESSQGGGKRWSGPVGSVWVRDFWQNYPKGVEVGGNGTTVWLFPELKPNEYDWAKGTVDEHRLFYWFDAQSDRLRHGGYKLRQGMSKTHEVWIALDGSPPQLDRLLFAAASPEWYAGTKAMGEFTVQNPDSPLIHEYDTHVRRSLDGYLRNRETNREFGMLNFGDWWGERVINWGNIEYDTPHAFFLQFARSGDLDFLRAGEEAEIHNRDIDTVRAHADPSRVGRAYAHCIGHVGNYLAKSPMDGPNQGTAAGGFTVSHTWCEGHADHYFLTGDRRSQETAEKIADNYGTYGTTNYDFTNCRIPGWHLILTMAVYHATGDEFYLNAAKIIVERVLERQTFSPALGTAGGGWRRMMVPGHCFCEPRHDGNAGFMVGVLLTGLKLYHQETGDPRVAKSIVAGAKFLVDDMWESASQGFRYTSCPKSSGGTWSNLLLFDGIGYAYRLSKDKDLARVMTLGGPPAIQGMASMGKSLSYQIRVAPHHLDVLDALSRNPDVLATQAAATIPTPFSGTTTVQFDASKSILPAKGNVSYQWDFGDGSQGQGRTTSHAYAQGGIYTASVTMTAGQEKDRSAVTVDVPPKWLLTMDARNGAFFEAESFTGQGGGQVSIADGRVGASASIVTVWEAHLGHYLEWKFTVPQTGEYRLVMKYCTASLESKREVIVDGAPPGDALSMLTFAHTGGFSTGQDNWHYLVPEANGKPATLRLNAGEHTIRMINRGGGLGVDWLSFVKTDFNQ